MAPDQAASIPHLKDRVRQFLDLAHLTHWEVSALVQMLFHGSATAQGLAQTTGVPKNKIYEVLDHLMRRNLAYTEAPGGKAYHCVHPEAVFDTLLRDARTMDAIRQEILPGLVRLYDRAADAAQTTPPESLPTVTNSRAAISSMLMQDLHSCHSEVMIAGHELGWLEENAPLLDQLEAAARRGVAVRLLCGDRDQLGRIQQGHVALECRVQRTPPLQSPIIVVGRRAVYMGVARGPGRAQANPLAYVRMRSPDITADMVRLFRETWETGEAVGTAGPA